MVVLVCIVHPAAAQQVTVCVDFRGSGLTADQQMSALQKVQKYYDDAGLGPGKEPRIIFLDFDPENPPTATPCDIKVRFV